MISAEQNMEAVVEYLLTQNADITVTCNDGKDIFELATNENIRDLLVQEESFSINEQQDSVTDEVYTTFNPFGFFIPSNEEFNSTKDEKLIISNQ